LLKPGDVAVKRDGLFPLLPKKTKYTDHQEKNSYQKEGLCHRGEKKGKKRGKAEGKARADAVTRKSPAGSKRSSFARGEQKRRRKKTSTWMGEKAAVVKAKSRSKKKTNRNEG